MNQATTPTQRADYGIDAPGVVRGQLLGGIAGLVLGPLLYFLLNPTLPTLAITLLNFGLWGGLAGLVAAAVMVWSSKVSKLRERERILDAVHLQGNERVLDLGCGRGLLLIGAAKRLSTGKAIGVDIWSNKDQSGNSPETTWANARAEGVADRVDVQNGDVRQLPFDDASYDAVVSSLVLHNLPDNDDRKKALHEVVRVLKPGGRVAIMDLGYTDLYAQVFRESGLTDVERTKPRFLFFFPTRIVTGRKSEA